VNKPVIQIDTRRAVPEWVADHPDQDIPKRVKLRIFDRCGGKCGLTGKKLRPGEFDFDHITRLRDGGEHRESNIHVVWRPKHREKTAQENIEQSHADRVRAKHLGIYPPSKRPLKSRGFEKTRGGQW
jgi:5-methylcytosine-specific restriction endonuclease McrA